MDADRLRKLLPGARRSDLAVAAYRHAFDVDRTVADGGHPDDADE